MADLFSPRRRGLTAAVLLAVMAPASAAPLDEIVLTNGSRILGTLVDTAGGVVTVDTEFAGTLTIPVDKIEDMRTHNPVVLKLEDGRLVEDQVVKVEDSELLLPPEVSGGSSYSLSDLALINPEPWELGEGYEWTGLASAALTIEDGNTDTEEFDYKLESQWRSLRDRYTVTLVGEVDEANGVKNAENWTATGKYDYFIDGDWYWGLNGLAEQDKFADLDLRYYVGPFVGYQFFDQPILTLSTEGGLAYVNEDFIVGEDKEYPGANWSVNASSNYLGGDSRLYLDHSGILNVSDTEDLVLNTTLGLAFPLMFNIEAAAELLFEYDGGVPAGVEEMDQTYRFRIGYTW